MYGLWSGYDYGAVTLIKTLYFEYGKLCATTQGRRILLTDLYSKETAPLNRNIH